MGLHSKQEMIFPVGYMLENFWFPNFTERENMISSLKDVLDNSILIAFFKLCELFFSVKIIFRLTMLYLHQDIFILYIYFPNIYLST
jgi:hypothetical protein